MTYSDRMTLFARIGFAARGLVYILVGWFALDVAINGGEVKDNQGALGSLAGAPMGDALLALCALGFAGYAVWRLTEAVMDPEERGGTLKGRFERAGYAMSGTAHVVLALAAARLALKQTKAQVGSPGDASAESWSVWLMAQPGGVPLLVLAGLVLFLVAGVQALKAYKARFDELDGRVPAPYHVRWIGRAGYAARAIIFAIIGWFVISAALTYDADRAGGLGQALRELRAQPEGPTLLAVVAFGLMLFGLFSIIESRYRRLRVRKPNFIR